MSLVTWYFLYPLGSQQAPFPFLNIHGDVGKSRSACFSSMCLLISNRQRSPPSQKTKCTPWMFKTNQLLWREVEIQKEETLFSLCLFAFQEFK